MASFKSSETFKQLMELSRGASRKGFLEEGFVLRLLRRSEEPVFKKLISNVSKAKNNHSMTLEQIQIEYRIYRLVLDKIIKLWMNLVKENGSISGYDDTTSDMIKDIYNEVFEMKKIFESQDTKGKYSKDTWSIEEAAAEMGIKKKTLQTKISNRKESREDMPWLIKEKGAVTRIRVKEFREFLKGHKKVGRPLKKS